MSALNGVAITRPMANEVEVLAKATRPRIPAEYKLKVLREADACTQPGELGALLGESTRTRTAVVFRDPVVPNAR